MLALLLGLQTASAQINDIYVRDGIVLTGNQWHFDEYSIMEANDYNYLVITPNQYYYYRLTPLNLGYLSGYYGDTMLECTPYVYSGTFGWYVRGRRYHYFCYPNGSMIRLSYVPVFHEFFYAISRLRHLNMRHWHWRHPRYHHLPGYRCLPNHHRPSLPGYNNKPHHGSHPPQGHAGRPPQNPRPPQGNVGRPPQNSRPPQGNVGRPPQNPRPPQGNVGRPPQGSQPPKQGNVSRPPQSSKSHHPGSSPSRSGGHPSPRRR